MDDLVVLGCTIFTTKLLKTIYIHTQNACNSCQGVRVSPELLSETSVSCSVWQM